MSAPISLSSAVTPASLSNFLPAGTLNKPGGIAATSSRLLVTDCNTNGRPEVLSVDSTGKVFRPAFATLPGICDGTGRNYLAIAPAPANPQRVKGYPTPNEAGFPSNFVFATGQTNARASAIFQIGFGGRVSQFASFSTSGCPDLSGITFDHVGSFHYRLIAVCSGGQVWLVGPVTRAPEGSANPVACPSAACQLLATVPVSAGAAPHGPDVVPRTSRLPRVGGSLLLAVDGAGAGGAIFAVSAPPAGAVTRIAAASSPESIAFLPRTRCTYASWAALPRSSPVYFAVDDGANTIGSLTLGAFADRTAGDALIATAGNGIQSLGSAGGKIVVSTFVRSGGRLRGSAFVDCGAPFLLRTFRNDFAAVPGGRGVVSVWILETATFNPLTVCVGRRLTAGGQACPALADPSDTPPTYGVTGTESSFAGCGSSLVSTAQGPALECKFYTNQLGIRQATHAGGIASDAGLTGCASILVSVGPGPVQMCSVSAKNVAGLQNPNYTGRLIIKLFFVGGALAGGEPGGTSTSGGEGSGSHGTGAGAPAVGSSTDNGAGRSGPSGSAVSDSGTSNSHGNGQGSGSGKGSGEQGDKGVGHGEGGKGGDKDKGDKGGHDKDKGGRGGGDGYAEGDD